MNKNRMTMKQMKRMLLPLVMLAALMMPDVAQAQTTNYTDSYGFNYSLDESTQTAKLRRTPIRYNGPEDLTLDTVTKDGKTYKITAMGKECFSTYGIYNLGEGTLYYSLRSLSMPYLEKMEDYCFTFDDYREAYYIEFGGSEDLDVYWYFDCHDMPNEAMIWRSLTTLSFPKLETMGRECFKCLQPDFYEEEAPDYYFMPELTTLDLPNLKTMERGCFDGTNDNESDRGYHYFMLKLTTLDLLRLETVGDACFTFNTGFIDNKFMPELKTIKFPISANWGNFCFTTYYAYLLDDPSVVCPISVRPIVYLTDASTVGSYGQNSFSFPISRFIVPQGKAAAVISRFNNLMSNVTKEVYSPVPVAIADKKFVSMAIIDTDATSKITSYTQDGMEYVNYYDFNYALTKEQATTNNLNSYPSEGNNYHDDDYFCAPYALKSNYKYKWYVANGYAHKNSQEGTLTITSPSILQGVRPGDGFMLSGPAVSGTGDDVLYVPVHTSLNRYEGTNYFKAGTGAAIDKESDGCRNFYYTDPKGFYECNNTVIPKGKAYLALPKNMTNNANRFTFVIDDGKTTGIVNLNSTTADKQSGDTWHTLDGRCLTGKPTAKGIYIHNGRKEVIR